MAEPKPQINPNPQLQAYYASPESVLGYDLLLGGTRHFGYYADPATRNPFPLGAALRRMEGQLFRALHVRPGSGARVLDAGCGYGHVARYVARQGVDVVGVDVVERHVARARGTAAGLDKEREKRRRGKKGEGEGEEREVGSFEVHHMDYHHLETLGDDTFDGVYTMETFVHATDPAQVLRGFFRVLKPGGRVVLHEYDNVLEETEEAQVSSAAAPSTPTPSPGAEEKKRPNKALQRSMRQVNEYSAMPTNAISSPGALGRLLEDAGFVDVEVRDLSDNIRPMTRLFYILAIVPFWLVSLLRVERYFVNTVAGVGAYRGYGFWRYVQVSATKPGEGALVGLD